MRCLASFAQLKVHAQIAVFTSNNTPTRNLELFLAIGPAVAIIIERDNIANSNINCV